ncbi:chemotaxis protein CheW [Janthinobacterium sp.]|uniref:chemotaxis protein CheW n=1 Tax=Janthinobacterium sp. TaxID=1871054 RepID=UPI00293D289E|nr:chemotaxis protein CheW [Janthinobacterium sp.]
MSSISNVHDINAAPPAALEFLAFALGAEEYAIDIQMVQELRGYGAVTALANAPDFIKGVINFSGLIVPIFDLRVQLKPGTPLYDQFTVVVILNLRGRMLGMVVDGVSDVVALRPAQIKPAPAMGGVFERACLRGLGVLDERVLILLDIERLLASPAIGLCQPLAA